MEALHCILQTSWLGKLATWLWVYVQVWCFVACTWSHVKDVRWLHDLCDGVAIFQVTMSSAMSYLDLKFQKSIISVCSVFLSFCLSVFLSVCLSHFCVYVCSSVTVATRARFIFLLTSPQAQAGMLGFIQSEHSQITLWDNVQSSLHMCLNFVPISQASRWQVNQRLTVFDSTMICTMHWQYNDMYHAKTVGWYVPCTDSTMICTIMRQAARWKSGCIQSAGYRHWGYADQRRGSEYVRTCMNVYACFDKLHGCTRVRCVYQQRVQMYFECVCLLRYDCWVHKREMHVSEEFKCIFTHVWMCIHVQAWLLWQFGRVKGALYTCFSTNVTSLAHTLMHMYVCSRMQVWKACR